MIRYTPANQLKFEEFQSPFEQQLRKDNKWVQLAHSIPWDSCAKIYHQYMDAKKGAPSIDARLVLGAILIKHMKGLSDRDVVGEIQENIYLQYFVGFSSFNPEPAFDPSLFVTFRKRLGLSAFEKMNDLIVSKALGLKGEGSENKKEEIHVDEKVDDEGKGKRQGRLKIDATVADQMIEYPTDLKLLNTAREETERLIDQLYDQEGKKGKKPRTYRRKARKEYLGEAMKKRKSKQKLRVAIGKQLRYLRRNIKTINKMWDARGQEKSPFNFRDLKLFWVLQVLYAQQNQMYEQKENRCDNRIVNLYQPHVRPIPRGKEKYKTEFGSKLGVSEYKGYCWLDNLSWEAYNEVKDLKTHVESFKKRTGYYPAVVLSDGKYLSRENRKWLKAKQIRHIGKRLGRPKELSAYEKRRLKKERGMRNHIEGKFGQGKNKYELSTIRARLQQTSESWIAGIFLSMNLVKWMQNMPIFFSFIELKNFSQQIVKLLFTELQIVLFTNKNGKLTEPTENGWNLSKI